VAAWLKIRYTHNFRGAGVVATTEVATMWVSTHRNAGIGGSRIDFQSHALPITQFSTDRLLVPSRTYSYVATV
jgi:hypothetical protein